MKCDENKPFCQKCKDTGRPCDGYESIFRRAPDRCVIKGHNSGAKSVVTLHPVSSTPIPTKEIDVLSRCFHTKTVYGSGLGCTDKARQILEASLSDSSIRHAVSALRALREDFEKSGNKPVLATQQTPSLDYGTQQYCLALKGLATHLSVSSGLNGLKSALLCCQLFISIEQVRENYTTVAQHIIQGLRIMQENRLRPTLDVAQRFVPAHHSGLPLIDIYVIKLLAAPCKLAEMETSAIFSQGLSAVMSTSMEEPLLKDTDLRTIAPDLRTDLSNIATSVLTYLGALSRGESAEDLIQLLSRKTLMLGRLRKWLVDRESFDAKLELPGQELVSASFTRFLHVVIKITLLTTLDSCPELCNQLCTEYDRLRSVAALADAQVKAYRARNRIKSVQGERHGMD